MALGGVGLDGHDHQVGVDPVGDERLGAVHHVVIALAPRARGHGREIRSDAGLGHRQRRDQLARGDPRKPALALLLGAVGQEVGQADVVVQRDPQAEAAHAGALGLLADDQVEAEVLRAGAAVALRHGHAEEAAAAGQREHLARHDPARAPTRRSDRPRRSPPAPGTCESSRGSPRGRPRTGCAACRGPYLSRPAPRMAHLSAAIDGAVCCLVRQLREQRGRSARRIRRTQRR